MADRDPKEGQYVAILTRLQMADRLGMSLSGFDDWRQKGLIPPPIPNSNRWCWPSVEARLADLTMENKGGNHETVRVSDFERARAVAQRRKSHSAKRIGATI